MTLISAIAFDLEGTVVDIEYVHHQAHILSARDVGITLSLNECFQLLPHFIGGPDEKVAEEIASLAAQRGIPAVAKHITAKYIAERKKYHSGELLKSIEIKPRDGFILFFQEIKKLGLKSAIGSLTSTEQALVLLERSGVGRLFGKENIVLREHVKNLKPAPDVWIETARRMKVKPEEQIVFEDSPRGIQGAAAVGAYCIGMPVYTRPDVLKVLTDAGAKQIFMGWAEINAVKLIQEINKSRNTKS